MPLFLFLFGSLNLLPRFAFFSCIEICRERGGVEKRQWMSHENDMHVCMHSRQRRWAERESKAPHLGRQSAYSPCRLLENELRGNVERGMGSPLCRNDSTPWPMRNGLYGITYILFHFLQKKRGRVRLTGRRQRLVPQFIWPTHWAKKKESKKRIRK